VDQAHVVWVVDVLSHVAAFPWRLGATERQRLVGRLARDWPIGMFERLVRAVVDVANSRVVHLEDSSNIQGDCGFWHAVALLQLLYAANVADAALPRVDEPGVRGPRVPLQLFILEGIDKCCPESELQRWWRHPIVEGKAAVCADSVELTPEFCSFLNHASFVPVSFRRQCLIYDACFANLREAAATGPNRAPMMRLSVRRDPAGLREDVLLAFSGLNDSGVMEPLTATFAGEPAYGPGVTTEFFQLALQAFLEDPIWCYDEQHRCYWFSESISAENLDAAAATFRACGVLVAQGILRDVLVPRVFPRCFYAMLLRDLGSTQCQPLGICDLATVAPEVAHSLEQLLVHAGDDIDEVYGSLSWPGRPECRLSHANKDEFVASYVDWFFTQRFEKQMGPFTAGFRAVLGRSELLKCLFDVAQLEAIICGGDVPVDVEAVRGAAVFEAWEVADDPFLRDFWDAVEALEEADRRRFLVFVTASDRMPLRGWGALVLRVQKNGDGDERLPTAFTCFNTLLLPRYGNGGVLRERLSQAIMNSQGFGLR